ncbi:MAG TPA: heat-inducible transcriptional repressor HrcA, partial [Rhodothermales bacterium]
MDSREGTYGGGRIERPALTDREREILRLVVRSFVETAGPVGSRFLARRYPLNLSAASIRNTMSDLEDLGYLDHPYTSAGRVPTELGYRKFVDELMGNSMLDTAEKQLLQAEIERLMGDTQEMLEEGSRLLGRLSNLLGVALSPRLATGILERLEVVKLSSTRIMFIISVRGGLVKTIIAEIDSDLRRETVDRVVPLLNERLAGLTLEEVRRTAARRIRDLDGEGDGVV